jgi:hypothetical protein
VFEKTTFNAQLSGEVEYVVVSLVAQQAIWMRRNIKDIVEKQEEPTTLTM